MSKKYILHIGSHKTGTTWLQEFLSANRERLLLNGIDFPLIGRAKHGCQAHRYFSAYFRGIKNEHPDDFEQVFAQEISRTENCIISSEDFYFCSRKNDSMELIHKKFGKSTHIICYLREPCSHILSLYQEVAKNKESCNFQDFLNLYESQMKSGSKFSYYNYDNNLDSWYHNFSYVSVVPYCKSQNEMQFANDFFKSGDIKIEIENLTYPKRSNVALSVETTLLLVRKNAMHAQGIINQEENKTFKKIILKHDQSLKNAIYKKIYYEPIDMSRFYSVFTDINKKYSKLFTPSSLKIELPNRLEMEDKEIIDLLYSFKL
ncbi:TPA: hypothetical protein R6264_002036 [Legionella pneumophila]|nr:hypothetical protein [Legionella pneumophila]